MKLDLSQIHPNRHQPRRHFDEQSIQELAQSIRSQGIIQPLVVRKSKETEGYELVAGERRWRALQVAKISEVEVVLKEVADEDLLEVALLENIQRENLTAIEEATSYRDLLSQHGYTQETLAKRIGKDRSTIANLIRLLQLPSPIQNDVEEGRLSVGHTRALLALDTDSEQLEMRERMLKKQWSVRQAEKEVKDFQAQKNRKPQSRVPSSQELDLQLRHLEETLERKFGTKVKITHKKNGKGQIQLDYHSLDDFDRVFELLNE